MNGFRFRNAHAPSLLDLVLLGPHVRLRTTTRDDAPEIFREFTPQVTKYMIPKPAQEIAETLAFIDSSRERAAAGANIQFTVEAAVDGEFLGCCGLHGEGKARTPEIGIWIKQAAHGHGYGREAIQTVCEWAFRNLELDFIVYPVDKRNTGSRKIPESLGAKVTGEERITGMGGNELDLVMYRIAPPFGTATGEEA